MAEALSKTAEESTSGPAGTDGNGQAGNGQAAPPRPPVLAYSGPQTAPPVSDWSPLRNPVFRSLWIASAVSYTGFEIRNYAAPLLMVDFKKVFGVSDGMAAYTLTASTLPIPFLVLVAGALADVLDRRKLLIVTHLWMMLAAGLLGLLTMTHLMTPWLMLGFLFVIGAGYAMANPALLAVLPELVEPRELRSAMALNSVNMNIARVLGPAIGGLVVLLFGKDHYYAGKGAAFLATALSLTGVIWVLAKWKPAERKRAAHPETVMGAVQTGFRYTWFSPRLIAILTRVFLFIVCAGIVPIFAGIICKKNPTTLHGDSGAAILMVCFGVGAILGVYVMQPLQRKFGVEETVVVGTVLFGLAAIAVAKMASLWLGCSAMMVAGFNWVIIPTNFNVATQLAVPAWVKGRAMGMYVLVLWGSFAVGSAVFGTISTAEGPRTALLAAGIGVIVGTVAIFWLRLVPRTVEDYAPAKRGPVPESTNGDGPVLVSIDYSVHPNQTTAFHQVMNQLRSQRLRNGALGWDLVSRPGGGFTESFGFASWRDRVRHHDRTTKADSALEDIARALHVSIEPPAVLHGPYTPPPSIWTKKNFFESAEYCLDRLTCETDRMFDRLSSARERSTLHRRRGATGKLEESTLLIALPVIRERK